MNKLLMEENDRLQKQVSQLVYENGYYRQQSQSVCHQPTSHLLILPLQNQHCVANSSARQTFQAGLATTDTSCESVVTSGQQNVAAAAAAVPQAQPRDASPAGYAILSWLIKSLPPTSLTFYFFAFAIMLWNSYLVMCV